MNTTSQADMNDDGIGNSGVLLIGWYNGGNTIEFLVKADQVAHPSIYRPYKEERQMITVSSAIQKNSEMASSQRSVTSGPGDANAFVKGTGMTADQKAEVAQRKANAAALVAASDKQV